MNEAQPPISGFWYCDAREKEMSFSSRLRNINSKRHEHKEKNEIVDKEYEVIKPKVDEEDYVLDDVFKDFGKEFFHFFEYRCVYDIKFTNIANNEKVIFTNTNGQI